MYPRNSDGDPSALSSIGNLLDEGVSAERPLKTFIGHNLGFTTFVTSIPLHEFYEMSEVANESVVKPGEPVTQRKLDPVHAQKLGIYVLKGLVHAAITKRNVDGKPVPPGFSVVQETLGKQPYLSLQPIVVNIRDCTPNGGSLRGSRIISRDSEETAAFKVMLGQQHVLWVVDGQHRRQGMHLVFEFLNEVRMKGAYPKKNSLYASAQQEVTPDEATLWAECFMVARSYCTIPVEIHLGLGVDEERQLFHDLNRLGKKVETSLALQFDSSNPINNFIKETLIDNFQLKVQEKDQADWNKDEGAISRKDLAAINAILFLNKTNISSANPGLVGPRTEIAAKFWEAVTAISGFGDDQAKLKTVAAQPVVLKALAKLVFDFAFSNRRPNDADELLEKLLDGISDIDFTHENPVWRYFTISEQERIAHNIAGLSTYLPGEESILNRDVGNFQDGRMRFGAKHNDIYPLIGDMIRWQLGLPSRN